MKIVTILIVFLFFIKTDTIAQTTDFFPCTLITNNNDTLRYKIGKLGGPTTNKESGKLIVYNDHGGKVIYTADQVKAFSSQGFNFISLPLKENPYNLKKGFVLTLTKGSMCLYKLKYTKSKASATGRTITKCIEYYYVRKSQDKGEALLAAKVSCEIVQLVKQPSKRNYKELCDYFSEAPKIKAKLITKEYKREEIEQIVDLYNVYKKMNKK